MEETTQPTAAVLHSLQARCAFCSDIMSHDTAMRYWATVTGYPVAFCCEDHRKTGTENPRACRITGQTRLIGCATPENAA